VKIAEIENKYENQKKQLQIIALERENTFHKTRSRYLVILFILLLLSAIMVFLIFRSRHKMLRQKHALSVEENKLKRMSLEKAALESQLKDEILIELNRVNNREPLREFEKLFKELHPNFYASINNNFPYITPRELQICALLSLNMQTKDISNITNISGPSLETIRYRIRKKMGLSSDQNLAVELMKY